MTTERQLQEDLEIEKLTREWSYEFNYWKRTIGFDPVELVESHDQSPSCEMQRMHIFKLRNGEYAVVEETGCSCYDSGQAQIEFHKDLKSAMEIFNKWKT